MEDDREIFLYMASLIHNGTYNYGIRWKDFYAAFSGISSSDPRKICSDLVKDGYVESSDDNDPFMIISRISVDASDLTIQRVFDAIRKDAGSYNLAICYSIEPSLVKSILSAAYYGSYAVRESPVAKALVPICTSDEFQKDPRVAKIVKDSISGWSRDLSTITPLIRNRWFSDLLFMLKNGKYGNGGFNYIENMETADRDEFIKGTVSLIDNGLLVTLILGLGKIISIPEVTKSMEIYSHRTRKKDRVTRVYSYLSIGNDIMVGLEFLIGSFEFLPSGNEILGVYLFIAGSSQLLIRPIIEISKRIHLYRINRTKIDLE
jgi:hypothetical protein